MTRIRQIRLSGLASRIAQLSTLALIVQLPTPAWALGDACPAPGSCATPHDSPGCADATCCEAVCDVDPVCCSASWDALCVEFATQLCTTFPGCGSSDAGSCYTPSGPRCNDLSCCESVCAVDAACCESEWDLACVDLADSICELEPPANDLCEGAELVLLGATPVSLAGCLPSADPLETPCVDEFGADAWFLFTAPCTGPAVVRTCATTAIVDTRIAVYAGGCDAPVLVACNDDAESCGAGTSIALFEATLDETYLIRVGTADRRADLTLTVECGASCPFETPPDAIFEIEDCGESSNRGCTSSGPEFEPLAIGDSLVGTVRAESGVRDTDWFTFEVTEPNTTVEARLTSLFDGSVYILAGSCPPEIITTYEVGCPAVARACLFPGTYAIFVAPNDFAGLPCGTPESRYLLELAAVGECDEIGCGGSRTSTCFLTSADPFCNDAACCQAVCAIDPTCCEIQWDGGCVEAAIEICLPPIPNDDCAGALPLPLGTTPFSTIGATTDDPQLPAFCDEGTGAYLRNDLWFEWTAPADGTIRLSTCGQADFDTRIALVSGDCEGEVVACNNNAVGCAGFTSELIAPVACGAPYLVRLGSAGLLIGQGLLTVEFIPDAKAPPCDACERTCAADLDRNGAVSGGDLSTLLAAWGTAPAPGDPARCADLDDDGAIDGADLAIMLAEWGPCQ